MYFKNFFRKIEIGRYLISRIFINIIIIFSSFFVKLPQALGSLPKYCQMPLYRTHERQTERENTTSTTQHYKIGESRAHQLEASAAALATTTTAAAAVHSEEAKEIILQFHEKKEPKILYCSFTKKKEIIEVIVLSATRYYIFEMI